MTLKGFQTFLETIRCWLRKATDAEVDTLYTLVSAERTRRGRPSLDAAPPAADQPSASDAADRDPPAGH